MPNSTEVFSYQPTFEDYKNFFEELPVALIKIEIKTGKLLMANKQAAKLFGYDSIEELQKNCPVLELCNSEQHKSLLNKLKKKGYIENYETQLNLPNKTMWISARLQLSDQDCIEGSIIDITDYIDFKNKSLRCLTEVGKKIDQKIATLNK